MPPRAGKRDVKIAASCCRGRNADRRVPGMHLQANADVGWESRDGLDAADAVVHYNGTKFDIPTINREFIEYGFGPPSPYKHIDLLFTVKRRFRFQSNKLEFVAKKLKIGKKMEHEGHQLWIDCTINHDSSAWAKMREYNRQDVLLTEKLYDKLLPWIQSHPNHNLYSDGTKELCPQCGNPHLIETKPVPLTAG